ncbi:hypothetical protein HID58_078005 [Brassica napus]|uniref:Glycosyltransferases n=1 Tax=Brassica napus TaxID=3708 RepID=A0ABQ7YS85_BRANA|nr:hypothetical protein HID58_078005 [Brassica napus]
MEGSLSLVLALMLDEASSPFNRSVKEIVEVKIIITSSSPTSRLTYPKALASKTHVDAAYVQLLHFQTMGQEHTLGINGWENMDGLENSTVTWNSRVTSVENYTAMKWREKTFIEQVVADESDMEGVPPACSRILNWHLHLAALDVPYPQGWVIQNNIKSVITVR